VNTLYRSAVYSIFIFALSLSVSCFAEVRALFSQKDSLIQELVEYIDREEQEIDIALYAFTHRDVLKALTRAQNRGVALKILLDPFSIAMAKKLDHLGTQVSIFSPEKRLQCISNIQQKSKVKVPAKPPLMHHKFFLFHKNAKGRSWVWTGSFNCTYSAENLHMENAVIIDDPKVFELFKRQFNQVRKDFSTLYEGSVSYPH
jgi:phosphatidylserine/phosphatidylglycerophosphate/cardiolipin synthase-like enzyme